VPEQVAGASSAQARLAHLGARQRRRSGRLQRRSAPPPPPGRSTSSPSPKTATQRFAPLHLPPASRPPVSRCQDPSSRLPSLAPLKGGVRIRVARGSVSDVA
jgi:hypothetical protein